MDGCRCQTLAAVLTGEILALEPRLMKAKGTASAAVLDARAASTAGGLADEHMTIVHREGSIVLTRVETGMKR